MTSVVEDVHAELIERGVPRHLQTMTTDIGLEVCGLLTATKLGHRSPAGAIGSIATLCGPFAPAALSRAWWAAPISAFRRLLRRPGRLSAR